MMALSVVAPIGNKPRSSELARAAALVGGRSLKGFCPHGVGQWPSLNKLMTF